MMGHMGWNMMGFGFFGWIIELAVIGLVVYFAVKFALKNTK